MMRLIVVAIFFESHKFFEYHIEFVLYVCVINCVFMYLCIFSGQFNPHFYFCYNQRFACDFADLKYELNDDGEERPLGPADKHLSGRVRQAPFYLLSKRTVSGVAEKSSLRSCRTAPGRFFSGLFRRRILAC